MNYLLLKLNKQQKSYWFVQEFRTMATALESLALTLSCVEDSSVIIETHSKGVLIWSLDDIKRQENKDFLNYKDFLIFESKYEVYYDKKIREVPKISLSKMDWKFLQEKWQKLLDLKTQYVVLISVKEGEYDKVDVFGKDELLEEDWFYIKQEHTKYLKYQEAKEKYIENHLDYSEVWRGPQDDEYEADIMKYYDQD